MTAPGGVVDGALTVLGAVIGWLGRARRHRRRSAGHDLEARVVALEKSVRRLWREHGTLQDSLVKLAVSMWEARRRGRRWHDPPR